MQNSSLKIAPRLGIFDSGIGGLSVLKALHAHLPAAEFLYVADSGHAPYGERTAAEIDARSHAITHFLLQQNIDLLVVACNTATAAAVATLRAAHVNLPIVGIEPGLKPAIEKSLNHRIGVMATTSTLSSEKFLRLMASFSHQADIFLQPCPGLATAIEQGDLDSSKIHYLVNQYCEPLKKQNVDTVVLGCTHYPLIAPMIQQKLGSDVNLIDTSEAIARRVEQVLANTALLSRTSKDSPRTWLWTSGDPDHLHRISKQWLGMEFEGVGGLR